MGEYVDVNGHPTWLDERGRGDETVIVLHGGLSNGDGLMDVLEPALADRYRLVAFDRRGHGRTSDTDEPFSYETMTDETIGVIERDGGPVHVVGWSDGGIIGLVLARRRPDLVSKMVLIGANFHHEGLLTFEMDPESPALAQIMNEYGERAPEGPEHLPVILEKTFTMFATQPTMTVDDVREIQAPTLVLVGDDEMVSLAHTCAMYEALPNGQLAVVPGATHAVPFEKPAETARLISEFLAATGEPQTMMPIRRAPSRSSVGDEASEQDA